MAQYLYVASDLSRSGVFESAALDSTTERHHVALDLPPLRTMRMSLGDRIGRGDVGGVVLQMATGSVGAAHLREADAVLRAGLRLWLHWPGEGAVECIDDERLRSLRRHRTGRAVLKYVVDPVHRARIGLKRLPAGIRWAVKGTFAVHQPEALDRLQALIERAAPVAFADGVLGGGRVRGKGVYVRTDFWNRIVSGGSYGHTCYVARELNRTSESVSCLVAQRYDLLDEFGVQQVQMQVPANESEAHMASATDHYYPSLKTACQLVRPAYLYERLCVGNYAAALLSRELKIPYIVEYNGSELSIQRSFEKTSYAYRYKAIYVAAEELAFRQATVVSVVSEIVRDDLISRGVDARKILVNPNGADLDSYAPPTPAEKAAVRRQLGFDDRHRVVGFTATFGGWHGVDVLAEALPQICAASPDIRFVLIGDGDYKAVVDKAIVDHDLEDRVRSIGRVPQAEGARLLKACDLYVAPHNAHMVDRRFFGSPTKIFEYMALGGGIVASDLEQIGDVLSPALRVGALQDGRTCVRDERAVLCTPGRADEFVEAVVKLAALPAVCEALGRNARRAVVEQFSWAKHVERLWQFAGRLEQDRPPTPIATGTREKEQIQHQWDHTPIGSGHATRSQPHTVEWFQEIEAHRYGEYAPWLPQVMEFSRHGGEEVLEIGGGLGIDLAQFASHGSRVTDVDLSAGHLALAEEHFRLRGLTGRFVHHDGEDLPFADATFDLVYSNGVIHHTPNTRRMVDEIHRVLRPGGRVIVMVYAENSLHYWRNLVFYLGMKQRKLERLSMGEIMSTSVEVTGNDARPLVKVYTRERLRRLFHAFDEVSIVQRQMVKAEVPRLLRPVRGTLERVAGWNLVLKATKAR
jgi:glycosyltransferase involved in cell wall biosynthesis/ubiquinone/menaquinone biosynthesis C-methylase UbiE